jgi:hypothetical protein
VIRAILDPKRFPWIAENRPPADGERENAVFASTVMAASQAVQTGRRSDEKRAVEGLVRGILIGLRFAQRPAPRGGILSIRSDDAPQPREFMEACNLGDNNADFVIGLKDHRLLVIEAKGSNSAINSRKRLNMEAAQKARAWSSFGRDVVPAAAIQGVFNPAYVAAAQDTPLVIFWGHRMEDLRAFLEESR